MAKIIGTGYAFDDVLAVPAESKVLPAEVNLKTRLTKNIVLNIPLVSAAMDTVTESTMAIAMARLGGLGVIHKGCSIKVQAEKVSLVKRSQSGQITKPYCLSPGKCLNDVRQMMSRHDIAGVPITENGKLVGLITRRDIKFLSSEENPMVEEIMKPRNKLIVSKPVTTLQEARSILQKNRIEKLPLVDENNNLKGMITSKDILREIEYPYAVKDQKGRLLVGAAVGSGIDLAERAAELDKAGVDVFCFDSAHGHHQAVAAGINFLKKKYSTPIIGGNVSTAAATQTLIDAGADAIKVGQGPGSICTTRVVTGCGMPQVTAIMNVFEVASRFDIPVIADGGIVFSGDITKALVAGASSVMIGSLLAGTNESPGETISIKGQLHKSYRGMGSIGAMEKSGGGRYFQSDSPNQKFVAEGVEAMVPNKGKLADVIYQLVGGLRAGMGYLGAATIKDLWQAQLILVTNAGIHESHPHDVMIIGQAPNYKLDQDRR